MSVWCYSSRKKSSGIEVLKNELQQEMHITQITYICKFLQLYVNSYKSEKEAKGMENFFGGLGPGKVC